MITKWSDPVRWRGGRSPVKHRTGWANPQRTIAVNPVPAAAGKPHPFSSDSATSSVSSGSTGTSVVARFDWWPHNSSPSLLPRALGESAAPFPGPLLALPVTSKTLISSADKRNETPIRIRIVAFAYPIQVFDPLSRLLVGFTVAGERTGQFGCESGRSWRWGCESWARSGSPIIYASADEMPHRLDSEEPTL